MRSAQRSMCAAMLTLQAVVLFLAGLVTTGLTDIGFAAALGLGLGLATLSILAAGALGRRGGYALGWTVQAVTLGLGLVVPMMFLLGAVFAALWAGAYFLGAKVDRERVERAELEEA